MIRNQNNEAVILLHGLAANRLVMMRLARFLKKRGYDVENWGYPSTRGSIDRHAARLTERIAHLTPETYGRLHFVTHSMGSIVTRRALHIARPGNLGRIVMLGPPNSGSHVARVLAKPLGGICLALRELSDAPSSYVNHLSRIEDVDLGVIAAAEDRVVKIRSTFLDSQRDHIVLPGHHGTLPWRKDTAKQVYHFLKHGCFHRSSDSAADRPVKAPTSW